jgi:hypothetical protein
MCKTVYYCNQEYGHLAGKASVTSGCFCAKCYIKEFHNGDVRGIQEKIERKNLEVCESRFKQIFRKLFKEKVQFT